MFRGLRTFPFLDALATDMEAVCPDAWLLNYTNPMAMNVQYLARTHPRVNVLGLCHSVYWTVHDLSELVGVPLDEVTFHSAGVNHQAWVLRWERDGQDLYPLLDERIAADPELRRRVRVDMYRRLGFYPTETSEHSSEYVPWYLHDDREIERLRIPVGDYLQISADNVKEIEDLIPQVAAGQYVEPDEDADRVRAAGHAQHGHGHAAHHPGERRERRTDRQSPAGSGDRGAVRASTAPARTRSPSAPLPPQCAALNRAFLNVVELTVRAAVEGSREHVRHALLCDPNTAATLSVDEHPRARRRHGRRPRATCCRSALR